MKLATLFVATLLALGCATASAPPPAAAVRAEGAAVVLVPGMTGSRLCDANTGAVVWGDSTRLLRPWDGGARLALPLDGSADDIRPCGAIREMRVAQWRKDIYGGLIEFLESNGTPLYVFDHDWRRDNVENARRLTAELARIAAERGDGRVHLLCQSNGGYICRYAARYGDVSLEEAERGERRAAAGVTIEKLILIGTANGGSLRILRELNRGRQYLRVIGRRFRPEVFFTYPSLYQDLPAYRRDLFVDAEGRPLDVDLFDAANWRTYGWSIFARERDAGAEREAYLRDMLQRAQRMHALLRSSDGGPLPRYYSIQSADFPTPARARFERDGRTVFLEDEQGDLHATQASQQALADAETAALAMPPVYVRGEHFEMITTDAAPYVVGGLKPRLTCGPYVALSARGRRGMGKYVTVLKETFKEFGEDKVPRLGAALAYYTIFSIGPLLLIAVAMAGLFFGQEAAQGKISGELGKIFGTQMAKSLEQMVQAAAKPKSGMLATIIGVITLMLGASGVFGQLKDALNTIWNVEKKKAGGIMGFVKERFLSMAMVLGIGFLLLVTLVLDTAISAMGGYVQQYIGGEAVAHALNLALSFAVATVLFAAIFRILPDLKIAWRDVWLGAVITALLFVIGKWGLGVYLGKAAPGSAYGAAGSLVILLIWVYWSAQILFLGAEFTQVYARSFGSLKGDTSKRDARAQAARPEDRPKTAEPVIRPTPVPMYAKQKSGGGGLVKVAAGGIAGLLFGAILGGVSTFVMVLKSAKKVLMPFK